MSPTEREFNELQKTDKVLVINRKTGERELVASNVYAMFRRTLYELVKEAQQ